MPRGNCLICSNFWMIRRGIGGDRGGKGVVVVVVWRELLGLCSLDSTTQHYGACCIA